MIVVVVALVAGCSGGTEEVTRDSSSRATTTTRDEPPEADTSTDDAASPTDPSSPDVGEDTAGDPSADGATGSTGTRPGRSGSAGTPATGAGGGASSPDAATPGDDEAPVPTTAPFRPDPDRYDTYVGLAREYGGDVASREDATALASVFCGDPAGARAEFLGGEPLGTYPSDLAIVRAYCPDKEPLF